MRTGRKRTRLAVIGGGFWPERAYLPAAPLVEEVEITGLVSADPARDVALQSAFGFGRVYGSFEEALSDDSVDAVALVVPHYLHHPMALVAIRAGKAVLCEKPLALNVPEAQQMLEAARSAGLTNMTSFTWRFTPAAEYARHLVRQGYIGELRSVDGEYLASWLLDPSAQANWHTRKSASGSGSLGDLGSHLADLAHYITGDLVDQVCASTRIFVAARPAECGDGVEEVDVDDSAVFLASFRGGGHGTFHTDRAAAGCENLIRLSIHGTEGALVYELEIKGHDWPLGRLYGVHSRAWDAKIEAIGIPEGFRRGFDTANPRPKTEFIFAGLLRSFALGVLGEKPVESDFLAGLNAQRVIDAALRSAETGTWAETGCAEE